MQFETDVLSRGRIWYRGPEPCERISNIACCDGLDYEFVLSRRLGSKIVIVFSSKPVPDCPVICCDELKYAGRLAAQSEGIYARLGGSKLWWWVEEIY